MTIIDVQSAPVMSTWALMIVASLSLMLVGATGMPVATTTVDEDACEVQGGTWAFAVGRCDLPTVDGGLLCTDSSQCESTCVADDVTKRGATAEGRCYERSVTAGSCLNRVEQGVAQGVVCGD